MVRTRRSSYAVVSTNNFNSNITSDTTNVLEEEQVVHDNRDEAKKARKKRRTSSASLLKHVNIDQVLDPADFPDPPTPIQAPSSRMANHNRNDRRRRRKSSSVFQQSEDNVDKLSRVLHDSTNELPSNKYDKVAMMKSVKKRRSTFTPACDVPIDLEERSSAETVGGSSAMCIHKDHNDSSTERHDDLVDDGDVMSLPTPVVVSKKRRGRRQSIQLPYENPELRQHIIRASDEENLNTKSKSYESFESQSMKDKSIQSMVDQKQIVRHVREFCKLSSCARIDSIASSSIMSMTGYPMKAWYFKRIDESEKVSFSSNCVVDMNWSCSPTSKVCSSSRTTEEKKEMLRRFLPSFEKLEKRKFDEENEIEKNTGCKAYKKKGIFTYIEIDSKKIVSVGEYERRYFAYLARLAGESDKQVVTDPYVNDLKMVGVTVKNPVHKAAVPITFDDNSKKSTYKVMEQDMDMDISASEDNLTICCSPIKRGTTDKIEREGNQENFNDSTNTKISPSLNDKGGSR